MRPVSEWEESDLDELHRGEIMESLTLEYPRQFCARSVVTN